MEQLDLDTRIEQAAANLATARAGWKQAVEDAKAVAIEAHQAGVTEVELAQLLGVDRARTLRRWLGK
jgi:hypothetical protein